jgi:hypothetical protein
MEKNKNSNQIKQLECVCSLVYESTFNTHNHTILSTHQNPPTPILLSNYLSIPSHFTSPTITIKSHSKPCQKPTPIATKLQCCVCLVVHGGLDGLEDLEVVGHVVLRRK